MGLHHRDDHGRGIPADLIIRRIAAEGLPVALAWPENPTPMTGQVDEYPTGRIPRIHGGNAAPRPSRSTA
jgi:hypothetical protein